MTEPGFVDSTGYEVRIKGQSDGAWASYFGGLEMNVGFDPDGNAMTTLSGPAVDQAALHGLLNRIRDLGLELLSVRRLGPGTGDNE